MHSDILNVAVLGSGRGSNFQAILTAIQEGKIRGARIEVVISNVSDSGVLAIARANGLAAIHLDQRQFGTEEQFVNRLLAVLASNNVNFIVLAGFMKRLHPRVIQAYRSRIINIHPALLPKFGGHGMYGMNVHRAVLAAGERVSGATVHIVDEEYDHGPILMQEVVPVDADDTTESLAAKVLKIEHRIYPEVLRLFAEGKIVVNEHSAAIHQS